MAFKRNDIKRISNVFECSENDVKSALYMCSAYLKKNSINTYTVTRSISIIIDKLQKINIKNTAIEYPDFSMKHIAIRKYRADIVALYSNNIGNEKGWGWIALELKRLHNVKVSRQTIRTYILKYQEWKQWQI